MIATRICLLFLSVGVVIEIWTHKLQYDALITAKAKPVTLTAEIPAIEFHLQLLRRSAYMATFKSLSFLIVLLLTKPIYNIFRNDSIFYFISAFTLYIFTDFLPKIVTNPNITDHFAPIGIDFIIISFFYYSVIISQRIGQIIKDVTVNDDRAAMFNDSIDANELPVVAIETEETSIQNFDKQTVAYSPNYSWIFVFLIAVIIYIAASISSDYKYRQLPAFPNEGLIEYARNVTAVTFPVYDYQTVQNAVGVVGIWEVKPFISNTLLQKLNLQEINAILMMLQNQMKQRYNLTVAGVKLLECLFFGLVFRAFNSMSYFDISLSKVRPIGPVLIFTVMSYSIFSIFMKPFEQLLYSMFISEADCTAGHTGFPLGHALIKAYRECLMTADPNPIYAAFHIAIPPLSTRLAALDRCYNK